MFISCKFSYLAIIDVNLHRVICVFFCKNNYFLLKRNN